MLKALMWSNDLIFVHVTIQVLLLQDEKLSSSMWRTDTEKSHR